jgi:hypothetical protein
MRMCYTVGIIRVLHIRYSFGMELSQKRIKNERKMGNREYYYVGISLTNDAFLNIYCLVFEIAASLIALNKSLVIVLTIAK